MRFLLPILLCLSCFAQPNPINRRAMAIAGLATPSTGPLFFATNYLAYRWVASDIATNSTIASWTDRLQGAIWTNGASANRPTNSLIPGATATNQVAIWFDVNHWLTNAGLAIPSNCAFGFVWNMIDPTGAGGTDPDFLSQGNENVCNNTSMALGFHSSPSTYQLRNSPGCDTTDFTGPKFGSLTNTFSDMIFTQALTNAQLERIVYTNSALSVLKDSSSAGDNYFGAANNANPIKFLARNSFRLSAPKFWLAELWVWSNSPNGTVNSAGVGGTNLLAITRTNFHSVQTNTYGYTP